jgi:extradiol dioxygenase family protein
MGWRKAVIPDKAAHLFLEGNHLVLHEIREAEWKIWGHETSGAPIPHLGLIASSDFFDEILESSRHLGAVLIEPMTRRHGTPYEHRVFFLADPMGIPWEIKCYSNIH